MRLEVLFNCENRRIGLLVYLIFNSCIVRLHNFLIIMLVRFDLQHSEHQNEINQMKLIDDGWSASRQWSIMKICDEIIENDKL